MRRAFKAIPYVLLLVIPCVVHANPILVGPSPFGLVEYHAGTRKAVAIIAGICLLVEYLVFRYFMKREAKIGARCALDFWFINAITWPATFFLGWHVGMVAEILPVTVEGIYYRWRFGKRARPYAISAVANSCSWVLGVVFSVLLLSGL